jgi:hypothetical protein
MVEHMQNTITKVLEIAVAISIAFQNLNLVVSPLGKAVCVGTVE